MKLHSPRLEKVLRTRVRMALRKDPQLRRQARRAPKPAAQGRVTIRVLCRFLLSVLLGVLIGLAHGQDWPVAAQSAIAGLWFLMSAIAGRFLVLNLFYDLPSVTALSLLPVSQGFMLRWCLRRVWTLAWRPFSDALVMLVVIAGTSEATVPGWLAVLPLAALSALTVFSMTVWLTFVRLPNAAVHLPPLAVGFLFLLSVADGLRERAAELFVQHCETLSVLLPGGWVPRTYLGMLVEGQSPGAWWLLPALGLSASVFWALRRWRQAYAPQTFAFWHSFGEAPAEWKPIIDAHLARIPAPPGRSEITEAIDTRQFLHPAHSGSGIGWVERLVVRWLTAREQAILELAVFRMRWTRSAWIGAALIGTGLVICWLGLRPGNLDRNLVALGSCGAMILAGALVGLPLASGFDRAFASMNVFGVLIPFHALFPVTLRELTRLALKAAVVRGLVFAPVMAMAGIVLGGILGAPMFPLAAAGLKAVLLTIVVTPWLQAANHAGGSNDTARLTWSAVAVLVLMGGSFLVLLFCGGAALFVPQPWSTLCLAAAAVTSFGATAVYGRLHARLAFDLMRRQTT